MSKLKHLLIVILLSLVGIPVMTGVVIAQEEAPHSGAVLCIGQVLNLPGIDIPEDTILIGFGVTDDFKCPSQARLT